MKRTITLLMAILAIFLCSCSINASASYGTVVHNEQTYTYHEHYELLKQERLELKERQEDAHMMAEAARALGYPEDHAVIRLAQQEWNKAEQLKKEKQSLITQLETAWNDYWKTKEEEYPAATYIWKYFLDLGYNEYVIAGIMGNLMAEVGGQTLDIQYWLCGNGYYGMCQWNKAYSDIWGKSLEEQCDYLRDTIEYEIDTFGYAYKKGFDYDAFLALDNEKDAALAFSKCYERNSPSSYGVRKSNATKALEYFID